MNDSISSMLMMPDAGCSVHRETHSRRTPIINLDFVSANSFLNNCNVVDSKKNSLIIG